MTERTIPLESRALALMRTAQGWKKNRLVKALGLQPGTLDQYESGDQTPSRQLLERAAAVMGYGAVVVDRTLAYIRQMDAARRLGSAAAAEREIDRRSTSIS